MTNRGPQSGAGSVTAVAILLLAVTLMVGTAAVVTTGARLVSRAGGSPDPVAATLRITRQIATAIQADPTPAATSIFDPVFSTNAGEGVRVRDPGDASRNPAINPLALNINLAAAELLLQRINETVSAGPGQDAVRQSVAAFLDERQWREILPGELSAAWITLSERGLISPQTVDRLLERVGTTSALLVVEIEQGFSAEVVFAGVHGSMAPVRMAIRTMSAMESAPSFSIMEAR